MKNLKNKNTLFDNLFLYLDDIYFECRQSMIYNIWYKIKCKFWYKYSTIKPRYLSHIWIDRDILLLHCSFEILCNFVEKELDQDHIYWEYNEEYKNAKQGLIDLYNWWIDCNKNRQDHYLLDKDYNAIYKTLYSLIKEFDNKNTEFYFEYINAITTLKDMHEEFVNNQLKKLIDLRKWMWT